MSALRMPPEEVLLARLASLGDDAQRREVAWELGGKELDGAQVFDGVYWALMRGREPREPDALALLEAASDEIVHVHRWVEALELPPPVLAGARERELEMLGVLTVEVAGQVLRIPEPSPGQVLSLRAALAAGAIPEMMAGLFDALPSPVAVELNRLTCSPGGADLDEVVELARRLVAAFARETSAPW